jgi:hypothetical protein
VTRLDRMKHGSGIKDRDDKSSGIDIRIADALAKINPTDPCLRTHPSTHSETSATLPRSCAARGG